MDCVFFFFFFLFFFLFAYPTKFSVITRSGYFRLIPGDVRGPRAMTSGRRR